MKYIRKFNEELKPSTYRDAANKFKHYNKDKKSKDLLDWADKKEFGYYNMTFVNDNGIIVNSTFTNPKLIGIYYGQPTGGDSVRDQNKNLLVLSDTNSEILANKLVNDWKGGVDELCISLEFGFQATNDIKDRHSYLSNPSKETGRWNIGQSVPMFSINLELSNWYDGLEEFDSDSKWEAENSGEEFEPTSLNNFYHSSAEESITLTRPSDKYYYGLFSDRGSSFKFINFIKTSIDDDNNQSFLKLKDKIMDILSIVGGETEDLERILKSFSKIRVHGLYDNELRPNNSGLSKKWFNKIIT
jgi:hypothetical protein